MKYDKFDMDKFKPNGFFLAAFIILFFSFTMLSENISTALLGGLSVLCLGWSFVFGEYKRGNKK